MPSSRREQAFRIRVEAAELAKNRHHPAHRANSDERLYAAANYAMSFTKGLEHCPNTGLLNDPIHFRAYRQAINNGMIDAFTLETPVPMPPGGGNRRNWEAPTAGLVFDLQGPDAQAVTMLPAPALGSAELAYELAEVYELALLRDTPLTEFSGCQPAKELVKAIDRLNKLPYKLLCGRGRPRKADHEGNLVPQTAFRGSSPGVEVGPYLSQFLLIGTTDQPGCSTVECGKITYGALQIDQKVPIANPSVDYMTTWNEWIDVQNGTDVQNNATLFDNCKRRFITTPRDLATYVHYDALYQAYLNACLILLEMKSPTDPAFDQLSGAGVLYSGGNGLQRQAGGFALFGGPHILTLVTEAATRALKAVRYQKFNNHLRLRPEALAARIEKAGIIEGRFPSIGTPFSKLKEMINFTVSAIQEHNHGQNSNGVQTALLPMAFQEGSPMHPSYGAGHAVVAGACVTMLKAFFDTSAVFAQPDNGEPVFKHYSEGDKPAAFVPNNDGTKLDNYDLTQCSQKCNGPFLTLEGELNKLAANISIGRNMAGVHYFSDYYDSLRMGEAVAIGILEEQALCYERDRFVLTLPTFDGGFLRIGAP